MEFRPRLLLRILGLGGPDRVWGVARFLLIMTGREVIPHFSGDYPKGQISEIRCIGCGEVFLAKG
jgi:hypothetical protein